MVLTLQRASARDRCYGQVARRREKNYQAWLACISFTLAVDYTLNPTHTKNAGTLIVAR